MRRTCVIRGRQVHVDDVGGVGAVCAPLRPTDPPSRQTHRRVDVGAGMIALRLAESISDAGARAVFDRHRLTRVRSLRFAPKLSLVKGPPHVHPFDVAARLLEEEGASVRYAEPCLVEHHGQRAVDPDLGRQWQWQNTGQSGGRPGADVSAFAAWARSKGQGIVIGMIDTGFHLLPHEIRPAVDSNRGFFRDTDGDAVFLRQDPPADAHGTACAAIAIARANGVSGRGIAPRARLLPIACLPDQTSSQASLARAIAYAIDPGTEGQTGAGADVVSCSLGTENGTWHMHSILEDALRFARAARGGRGVPVFWAVANANVQIAVDEVNASGLTIPVGATDHRDVRAACAHGPELAFMAPGVRVVSTLPGELTATVTGTSFAAPTAAGIAALVLSVNPGLSADEVAGVLTATCDRLPAQVGVRDDRHGAGRLNAAQAVEAALALSPSPVRVRR